MTAIALKIAIAEPSCMIRCGLETLLKRLPGFRIQLVEIATAEILPEALRMHRPDVLIVNPVMPGSLGLPRLKEQAGCPALKCVALLSGLSDSHSLTLYDAQITLYDCPDEIKRKLERLQTEQQAGKDDEEQQTLSVREKEIVVCVVKGMTNREIADQLFLSTHTVITHRRNIARKLQIHSPSGLTVYAIVNKLVELRDIE